MLRGAIVVVSTLTLMANLLGPSVASAETVGFRNPIADGAQRLATCGNALLAAQFADALTTRAILRNGGYERDPLAVGVVRSGVGAYGSAIVLNALARFVTRNHPQTMCYLAGIETAAVANNLRILGRQR
jgi:hypothetical protein